MSFQNLTLKVILLSNLSKYFDFLKEETEEELSGEAFAAHKSWVTASVTSKCVCKGTNGMPGREQGQVWCAYSPAGWGVLTNPGVWAPEKATGPVDVTSPSITDKGSRAEDRHRILGLNLSWKTKWMLPEADFYQYFPLFSFFPPSHWTYVEDFSMSELAICWTNPLRMAFQVPENALLWQIDR